LRVRHANVSRREALEGAAGKNVEVIDQEEDVGAVSGGRNILR